MWSPTSAPGVAKLLSSLLLLATGCAAMSFDCSRAVIDGVKYDLHELGGPRAVVTSRFRGAAYTNTSYTLDICKGLERSGDVPKGDECPMGTRVCAIRRRISLDGTSNLIDEVIAIAGDLEIQGGTALDAKLTRLTAEDTSSKGEGLRLVLQGGAHFLHDPASKKRAQRAVIDFLCDEGKTGKEGFWKPEDHFNGEDDDKPKQRSDDDKKEDDKPKEEDHEERQLKHDDSALIWNGYGPVDSGEQRLDVLRLTWYTKAVCSASSSPDDGDAAPSAGWSVFRWLVVIPFLGIAAYLIFGSWLNYNRYGARGWDLLPHGDTIRDIPYLLGDWVRKVLNTVQGAGTRGGYTAV